MSNVSPPASLRLNLPHGIGLWLWALVRAVLVALVLAPWAACVHSSPTTPNLGLQHKFEGFVPARIAVLPCQEWPEALSYRDRWETNAPGPERLGICERIDTFVLKGFEGQPYMKGFSPHFVRKALSAIPEPLTLDTPTKIALNHAGACRGTPSLAACYNRTLASDPAWLLWLNRLSTKVRHADAVLLPILDTVHERRYDDRGLQHAERRVEASLLLVSTTNGALIWIGARQGITVSKRLRGEGPLDHLSYPNWSAAEGSLYEGAFWHDFPGRQIL